MRERESKLYTKWKQTGLLDSLTTEEAIELSVLLESSAELLINNVCESNFIKSVLIPAVARVYYKIKINFNINELCNELDVVDNLINDNDYLTCLDAEMEKTLIACDNFIKKFIIESSE